MNDMTPGRAELIAQAQQQAQIIAEQQATIDRLEQRVRELEGVTQPPPLRRLRDHQANQTPTNERPPRTRRSVTPPRRPS